jgi:hypothetical protein
MAANRRLIESSSPIACGSTASGRSLELFAERVMPEFKERDEVREAEKRREPAPYIEAALAQA